MARFGTALLWLVAAAFIASLAGAAWIYQDPMAANDYLDVVRETVSDLGVERLWRQHNEHRLAFTRLMAWGEADLLKGALWPSILASLLCVGVIYGTMLAIVARHIRGASLAAVGVGIALILFRARGMDIYVTPVNTQFAFAGMWFCLGLWIIHSDFAERYRGAAILLTIIAMMFSVVSSANGVVVWPIYALAWLRRSNGWRGCVALLVSGGAMTAIYFHHYVRPSNLVDPLASLAVPGPVIRYLIAYLGNVWIIDGINLTPVGVALTAAAGLAAIWVMIVSGRSRRFPNPPSDLLTFGASMLMFGGATALMTALGRFNFGIEQASSVRYVLFQSMIQAGALMLVVPLVNAAFGGGRGARAIFAVALMVAVVGFARDQVKEIETARLVHDARVTLRDAITATPPDLSRLGEFYPNHAVALDHIAWFSERRIFGFGR